MNRLGWFILGIIVLAGAAFLAMTSFGTATAPVERAAARPAPSVPLPGELMIPVAGVGRSAISDSWGDTRSEGRGHHGTDIAAPARTPVVAAAAGTIEKLFQSERGGTTLYVRSADGRWRHYYAHLAGYAAGVREGLRVQAGDRIGYVGDTGDAGAGNYHLHFGLTRVTPGQRWWEGEEINPYPLLATGRMPE
ncbi:M23 family metallopeptidase [Sphingomonas sp.]|uniref:M23 family metallopeptidase n=1 Tax=Sphingomonas sp. TaxID=28214 RepID=UPI002EDA3DC5